MLLLLWERTTDQATGTCREKLGAACLGVREQVFVRTTPTRDVSEVDNVDKARVGSSPSLWPQNAWTQWF